MDSDFFLQSSRSWSSTRSSRESSSSSSSTSSFSSTSSCTSSPLPPSIQIHREAFKQHTVICQVSECFILVRCQNYLLAFDQHAVHERVRVDRFIKLVYNDGDDDQREREEIMKRKALKPPVVLTNISTEEFESLTQPVIREFLSRFHIEYQLMKEPRPTVIVRSAPYFVDSTPSIRDFLPSLLQDIRQATPGWPAHLRPSTIQYILNSKACRGAIMFHTPLSRQQCEALVQDLSKTAFPFQCAHGRPSVVPLPCKLGGGNDQGDDEEKVRRRRKMKTRTEIPLRFRLHTGNVPQRLTSLLQCEKE